MEHAAKNAVRGFTVLELMIVVVVTAILIAVAAPSFQEIIRSTRIKNASFDVFSSLVHARSEAITRNTTVTVQAAGGWAQGWTVTESGGTVVRQQDPYSGIAISTSSGDTIISYNGMGRLTGAFAQQFTVTATGASDAQKRCVIIDPSGRPVTKTGACS
jgi:type IV fimbrial biogenesis protein FimT